MKVWMSTDSHFGIKNNNREWFKIQKDYYEKFFLEKVKEKSGPDDILIHLGDVYDNRELLDISIMNYVQSLFFKLSKTFKEVYVICGNHDTYQNNTNIPNSLSSLNLKGLENLTIIDKENTCLEITRLNKKLAFLPWQLNSKMEKEVLSRIKKSDYLFMHSSVVGAVYSGNRKVEHGNDVNDFLNFRHVYTGHIHTSQKIKNVRFLGSPYELTRNDRNNKKSIWYFDLETEEEFEIENDFSPRFLKLKDSDILNLSQKELDKIVLNNFVDVVIHPNKKDTKDYKKISDKIAVSNVRDAKIEFLEVEKTDTNKLVEFDAEEAFKDSTITEPLRLAKAYLEKKGYKENVIEKVLEYVGKLQKEVEK